MRDHVEFMGAALAVILFIAGCGGFDPTFGLDGGRHRAYKSEYQIRVDSKGVAHCHKRSDPGNTYYPMDKCN